MPKYLVTDGVKYLRIERGKVSFIFGDKDASAFLTYMQAQQAIEDTISEWMRDGFYIEETEETEDYKLSDLINADTTDHDHWIADIGNFQSLLATRGKLISKLEERQREVDDEILDIRHYIEFNRLNAHKGWEAYEMLRVSLIERRKIKNALFILVNIHNVRSEHLAKEFAKRAIQKLNRRRYKPRRLHFLF